MLRYHGANLIRPGFIGAILLVLVILVGLSPDRLLSWATAVRYRALFDEAGGLAVGNVVTVSGMKVGTVSHTALQNGYALVTFTVPGKVQLGSDSTAHIRTGTLLGQRVLTVESAGTRPMRPNDVIPLSRTSSRRCARTAACVPTGMNVGVRTSLCSVRKRAARAREPEAVASNWKSSRVMLPSYATSRVAAAAATPPRTVPKQGLAPRL